MLLGIFVPSSLRCFERRWKSVYMKKYVSSLLTKRVFKYLLIAIHPIVRYCGTNRWWFERNSNFSERSKYQVWKIKFRWEEFWRVKETSFRKTGFPRDDSVRISLTSSSIIFITLKKLYIELLCPGHDVTVSEISRVNLRTSRNPGGRLSKIEPTSHVGQVEPVRRIVFHN